MSQKILQVKMRKKKNLPAKSWRIFLALGLVFASLFAFVPTQLAQASRALPLELQLAAVANPGHSQSVFYTTVGAATGRPNGAEIYAIDVSGSSVTTRDIGATYGGDCGSLALSPGGTLYSMCGSIFGAQWLATINQQTGRAVQVGTSVSGLAVMSVAFSSDGILYAVGDCNPTNYECTPGSDPNYNSLYRVNVKTGEFTRIGSTGAPQFFMDLAFDRNGKLYGVTTTVFPSAVPAILYRIDLESGKATKLVTLVGSNRLMGLAFGRNGMLYATDFAPNSNLYAINRKTGVETTISAVPFGFSSSLELMNLEE